MLIDNNCSYRLIFGVSLFVIAFREKNSTKIQHHNTFCQAINNYC
jgi:hypothetical protein